MGTRGVCSWVISFVSAGGLAMAGQALELLQIYDAFLESGGKERLEMMTVNVRIIEVPGPLL